VQTFATHERRQLLSKKIRKVYSLSPTASNCVEMYLKVTKLSCFNFQARQTIRQA